MFSFLLVRKITSHVIKRFFFSKHLLISAGTVGMVEDQIVQVPLLADLLWGAGFFGHVDENMQPQVPLEYLALYIY